MSVFEAELVAVLKGVKLALEKGYGKIVVETDSLGVFNVLVSDHCAVNWKWLNYLTILDDITQGKEVKFSHILRDGNKVADLLAEEALVKNLNMFPNLTDCSVKMKRALHGDISGIPFFRIPK